MDEVVELSKQAIFGRRLVLNIHRAILVEAIVSAALPDWEWCSDNYSSYDFRHRRDETRLEVKQTALKQTWTVPKPATPSWDIKPRTGYWEDGSKWVPEPGRCADIYVLALHPRTDEKADHRDASQWRFYVFLTSDLPNTQRLSEAKAKTMAMDVGFDDLSGLVEKARAKFRAGEISG